MANNSKTLGEVAGAPLNASGGSAHLTAEMVRLLFQGKWRLPVVRQLIKGPARLSELRRMIPDCSKKVLIDTLRSLEKLHWVEREEFATKVKHVEYRIFPQISKDLSRVVHELEHLDSSV